MFTRIMAVVLAVILLITAGFAAFGLFSLRQERIGQRLEALTGQAREIAWLAAQNTGTVTTFFFGGSTAPALNYLTRKAEKVYQDYGAYILVVDRRGRLLDNFRLALQGNPDFVTSLNDQDLSDALSKVMAGSEVVVRTAEDAGETFTVGVPFVQNDRVLGAVLIRTPAQTVEGSVWEFGLPLILIGAGALTLAGIVLFLYIRRAMKPLRALTEAAGAMAGGDFSRRVPEADAPAEIAGLAHAFNSMSARLAETETSRREFVANVSHELRSPITSIAGFVQGMADGTIPPEDHPKYLQLVNEESRRLSKLIGDLLALSRLERDDAALTLSRFNLCEMFRRAVIRRIEDLERKHIEIITDFAEDPCDVQADADRIEQVVVNLVDNAIKFTPAQGHITLRTRCAGGTVTAAVADDGAGIAPADQPHVFDRFFTADRAHTSGKGTGLGLSICQRILEMHGHRIWLERSGEGEGAVFCFTLDAADKSV